MLRPLARLSLLLLAPVLLLTAASPASAATRLVTPKPIDCHKMQSGGAKVCSKKIGKVDWSKGWWSDPTSFKVVDANIYSETRWEIPFDGFKSFSLTGYMSVNAKRNFKATLRFPRRKAGVSAGVMTGGPVKGAASSEGAWTTQDGIFQCGVSEENADGYAPSALTGVVAMDPKRKAFSIQWAIFGAPVRCGDEGPANPTAPEVSSDAFTTRYSVAALRKGDLFKLPVRASWTDRSSLGTLTVSTGGSIVIQRVQNAIR